MEQQPAKKRRLSLEDKLKHAKETHSLKEPCTDCPRGCLSKINQMRRITIYLQYWSVSYNERKSYIRNTVDRHNADTKGFSSQSRSVRYNFLYL